MQRWRRTHVSGATYHTFTDSVHNTKTVERQKTSAALALVDWVERRLALCRLGWTSLTACRLAGLLLDSTLLGGAGKRKGTRLCTKFVHRNPPLTGRKRHGLRLKLPLSVVRVSAAANRGIQNTMIQGQPIQETGILCFS